MRDIVRKAIYCIKNPKQVFNIIYFKIMYVFKNIFSSKNSIKNILFYCNLEHFEEHFNDYYNCIIGIKNIRIYLLYYNYLKKQCDIIAGNRFIKGKEMHLIDESQLGKIKWDLLVSSDLLIPPFLYFYRINKKMVPRIYINHGLHIISVDKQKLYAYGNNAVHDQECKFSVMLEGNKYVYDRIKNYILFKDIIKFTGYKFCDSIINNIDKKDYYKNQLGIKKEEVFISVFSTWGNNCLFRKLGEGFIDKLIPLLSKNYKIMLSIHPREYYQYNAEVKPLGAYIDAQEEKGFIIRKPLDDWLPYLIASDLVISDYSTMYELAIIAHKKLIISDYDDSVVSIDSLAIKAKKVLDTINCDSNVENIIEEVLSREVNPNIIEFSKFFKAEKDYKSTVYDITKELLKFRE